VLPAPLGATPQTTDKGDTVVICASTPERRNETLVRLALA